MNLTDISIRSLKTPERGAVIYWDDSLGGFGVRVSSGGTKSFVLTYGRARRRVTIGTVGRMALKDARSRARIILAEHELSDTEEITTAFSDALDRFLVDYSARNKPSTAKETERLLRKHLLPKLERRKLPEIRRGTVVEIIDSIDAVAERAHAYTAARTFFRWCRRYGVSDVLEGTQKPVAGKARTRLITAEEFRAIWRATASLGPYGSLVRLLFVTGQRAGQIAGLHADLIDKKARTIRWPPALMKSNKEHAVPYGALTAELLEALPQEGMLFPANSGRAFNSWSSSKRALDEVCRLPHWTHHDARRFFSSTHAAIGTPLHLTERLLAHTGGVISGVAAIYNLYQWSDELRSAATAYEVYLHKLLNS